jgi:hypothetical protein
MNMQNLEDAGDPLELPEPPKQLQLPGPDPEKGNGKDKGAMQ